jgi:hypothetical protein
MTFKESLSLSYIWINEDEIEDAKWIFRHFSWVILNFELGETWFRIFHCFIMRKFIILIYQIIDIFTNIINIYTISWILLFNNNNIYKLIWEKIFRVLLIFSRKHFYLIKRSKHFQRNSDNLQIASLWIQQPRKNGSLKISCEPLSVWLVIYFVKYWAERNFINLFNIQRIYKNLSKFDELWIW